MCSSLRWYYDVFDTACGNGEIVRVALVIDAHREIIGWHGVAGAGIGGEAIRGLMPGAVAGRFGALVSPHAVEWLSGNGAAHAGVDPVS